MGRQSHKVEVWADRERDVSRLEPIAKGGHGWKNRRAEILIIETLKCATVPHCCHRMWQKLQHKISISAEHIATLLHRLADQGFLCCVGHDEDGEALYIHTEPEK